MLSEMAAPDREPDHDQEPRRTKSRTRPARSAWADAGPGPKDRAGPGEPDRHGTRTDAGSMDQEPRRTRRAGPARHTPARPRAGPRPGAAAGGRLCRWMKTALQDTPAGPGRSQASRAGGVLRARYSLLIAGYICPPSPHQPAGPDPNQTGGQGAGQDGTGGPGPDPARPATPDHQTAPAQNSTHTRTGANQNRARGRRYSLGLPRRLRVRERGIFLDVREIFSLPPAVREKVRGSPKNRGIKSGGVCEQIMNFREVAHCVPIFVID